MAATWRVEAYVVTGASERLFPATVGGDVGPAPSTGDIAEMTEWGWCGFSLSNTSSSASIRITFTDDRGVILDTLVLDPFETRSEWYGPQGITLRGGVTVAMVDVTSPFDTPYPTAETGDVVGSIRVG